jgi:hypothetical protein
MPLTRALGIELRYYTRSPCGWASVRVTAPFPATTAAPLNGPESGTMRPGTDKRKWQMSFAGHLHCAGKLRGKPPFRELEYFMCADCKSKETEGGNRLCRGSLIEEVILKIYQLKPTEDKWTLCIDGRKKPLTVFDSKREALKTAGDLVKQRKGRLIVYRKDGTIEMELLS